MSVQYNDYLIEHISNVKRCVQWLIDHEVFDYDAQSTTAIHVGKHDESKYDSAEYDAYDAYFYGEKTDEVREAFDYAWLRHIQKNPHHWQHWVLLEDEGHLKALEMPKEYVYEMIADWWSFSWKEGNLYEIFNWYAKHEKKMILHPDTRKLVEDILDKINQILDGEEERSNESN